MRLRQLRLAGVLVVGLAGLPSLGCRLATEQQPATVEAKAADFSLAAHDGRTVTLGDLVAKGPTILVFYRGHW